MQITCPPDRPRCSLPLRPAMSGRRRCSQRDTSMCGCEWRWSEGAVREGLGCARGQPQTSEVSPWRSSSTHSESCPAGTTNVSTPSSCVS